MQMTDYSHLVCHFYCNISISFLKILFVWAWCSARSLTTPSDRFFIIMYYVALLCLLLILSIINMEFAVCIPKKIHRNSVFLFHALIQQLLFLTRTFLIMESRS